MKRNLVSLFAAAMIVVLFALFSCDDSNNGDDNNDDDNNGIALMKVIMDDDAEVFFDSTIHYGDLNIGSNKLETYSIVNTGETDIIIEDSWLWEENFIFTAPENGVTLAPLESTDFSIRFAPVSYGDKTGEVTLNFSGINTFTFKVSGKGLLTPYTLAPPAWIQGVWKDAFDINTWVFSIDNATFATSGYSYDFAQLNRDYADSGYDQTGYYDEEPTASHYRIIAMNLGSEIGRYDFNQTSAATLNYQVDEGSVLELVKQ